MFKEKKLIYLSLGNWPQKSIKDTSIGLTPITKRILKQVHLRSCDLLPLSYHEYLKHSENRQNDSQVNKQNYQYQNQRRKKQAIILSEIRNKYIQGKQYHNQQNFNHQQVKSELRSREKSKTSQSYTEYGHQFSKMKEPKIISKVKSAKKIKLSSFRTPISSRLQNKQEQSDYFINFNPHKSKEHIKTTLKDPLEEQSTRCKYQERNNIKIQQKQHINQRHEEYGCLGFQKNMKIRVKKDKSITKSIRQQSNDKTLCHQLIKTMEKWQKIDQIAYPINEQNERSNRPRKRKIVKNARNRKSRDEKQNKENKISIKFSFLEFSSNMIFLMIS